MPVLLNKSTTLYKGNPLFLLPLSRKDQRKREKKLTHPPSLPPIGRNYLEIDVNMHQFSFLSRKGMHYMKDKIRDLSFDIGIMIEGRGEEELPEQVGG